MTFAIALLALTIAPAFVQTRAPNLPPDLDEAVREYTGAELRNDVRTLGRLFADDYVLVNSDASVQNKEQSLADFLVPGFKVEPYVVEEPIERVWGAGAVLAGLVHLTWTQAGQQHSRTIRIVHVWAKRDGRWRLTYTQVTRVPTIPSRL